nr:MAG TPA: hypothetical protein [Caudoviricetes sp.]
MNNRPPFTNKAGGLASQVLGIDYFRQTTKDRDI